MTDASSIRAIRRSRPPQFGQASTSKPNVRRIRSAHRGRPARHGGALVPSDGSDDGSIASDVSVTFVPLTPGPAASVYATTNDRHAARGASTP